jgi:ankyrin repeat protein
MQQKPDLSQSLRFNLSLIQMLSSLEAKLTLESRRYIAPSFSFMESIKKGVCNGDQLSEVFHGLCTLWGINSRVRQEILGIVRDLLTGCEELLLNPSLDDIRNNMICRIASMADNNIELLRCFSKNGYYPYAALKVAVTVNNVDTIRFFLTFMDRELVLNAAAKEDDRVVLIALLQNGTPPYLALSAAINVENFDNAKFILQHIDRNIALNTAAKENNLGVIGFLLQNGADPHTALSAVIGSGNLKALELFMKNGADPNAALIVAIRTGSLRAVEFILQLEGVDLSRKNPDGRSLLSIAIQEASSDPKAWGLVVSLLMHGAEVEGIDNLNDTGLLNWILGYESDMHREGAYSHKIESDKMIRQVNKIQYLMKRGVIKQQTLNNMLDDASGLFIDPTLNELLATESYFPLPMRNYLGQPDTKAKSSSLFNTLLSLNLINNHTVLNAYHDRLYDTITLLIAAGASFYTDDWTVRLRILLFRKDVHQMEAELIRAKNNSENQLWQYLLSGEDLCKAISLPGESKREIVDLLLAYIQLFEPDWRNVHGYQAIRMAILRQDLTTVRQLLALGANIEPPRHLPNSDSLLHLANSLKDSKTVKLLLSYGANPYTPDPESGLPLTLNQMSAKNWSELIFHHKYVEAYHELQRGHDNTLSLPAISAEDKEFWIKRLLEVLEAIPSSKPLWYQKVEREIVSILIEKIPAHHDSIQLAVIAIAAEKTFHNAELEIPQNIQFVLDQLKKYISTAEIEESKVDLEDGPPSRKLSEASEAKEDEIITKPISKPEWEAVLERKLVEAIKHEDANAVYNLLINYPAKQTLLDTALKELMEHLYKDGRLRISYNADGLQSDEILAKSGVRYRILSLLLQAGANPIQKINESEQSAKFQNANIHCNSPLLIAALKGQKSLVELLLEYSAGDALYVSGSEAIAAGYPPLKELDVALLNAVLHNQLIVAEMLLSKGANVDNASHLFDMPFLLHVAGQNKVHILSIGFLLKKCGIDPRTKGPNGETLNVTYKNIFDALGGNMGELVFQYELIRHSKFHFELSQEDSAQLSILKHKLSDAFAAAKPLLAWNDADKKMRGVLVLLNNQLTRYEHLNFYALAMAVAETFKYAEIEIPKNVKVILDEMVSIVKSNSDIHQEQAAIEEECDDGPENSSQGFILEELEAHERKEEEESAVVPRSPCDILVEEFQTKYRELCQEKGIDPEKSYQSLTPKSKAQLQKVESKDLTKLSNLTASSRSDAIGALFYTQPKKTFSQWINDEIKKGYFDNDLKLKALADRFEHDHPIKVEIAGILDKVSVSSKPQPLKVGISEMSLN